MAIIGELQTYTAECGSVPADSAVWIFPDPYDRRFYTNCIVTNLVAGGVPLINFTGTALSAYYVGADNVPFQCNKMCSGVPGFDEGTDLYVAPQISNVVTGGTRTWEVAANAAGKRYLALGLGYPVAPGFTFACDVQLPQDQYGDGAGTIAYSQLVSGQLIYTGFDGQTHPLNVQMPLLDTSFPYTGLSWAGVAGQTLPGCLMSDSPQFPLPQNNCQSVQVNLNFTVGVMYKSSSNLGAIWTRLGALAWSTSVVASKPANDGTPDWLIPPGQQFQVGAWTPGYDLPFWTGNISTVLGPFITTINNAFGTSTTTDALEIPWSAAGTPLVRITR